MADSEYLADGATLVVGPACTIRTIAGVHASIMGAGALRAGADRPVLRIDCSGVEQADVTFVQLIASAQATMTARGGNLVVERASACVDAAFARAGVRLFEQPV